MNENLQKSVFLKVPVVVLGTGLLMPLLANAPLRENLLLGGAAIVALFVITLAAALFTDRLPHNSRTGIAIVLSGGATALGALIARQLSGETLPPFETLVPLLLTTALFAFHTEAYAVKKPLQPALLDAAGIGACFLALLAALGFARDFLFSIIGTREPNSLSPVIFMIVCPIAAVIAAIVSSGMRRKR